MSGHRSLKEIQKDWHGSYRCYAIGFFSSLLFTVISFGLVSFQLLSGWSLLISICTLGLIQAGVQLRYFLHMGDEATPKWESYMFAMMFGLLFIVVIGTLWVMFDLNARMMPDMHKGMHHG